ncbi:MAG TPA: hypothetical protein DCE41_26455 [Cytophagales bacterium]|nr:hypothetical protein [Cytophagales bacterium]HAA22508.1 hypothetical protein [Cytophagales bacterium]HAP61377.1 hypothetical protein [Cytophagales bacterium]
MKRLATLLFLLMGVGTLQAQITRKPDTLSHFKSLYVGIDAGEVILNGASAVLSLTASEDFVTPTYWGGALHMGRDVVPTIRYDLSLGYLATVMPRLGFQRLVYQTLYAQGKLHFFKPLPSGIRLGGYLGFHYDQTQGYFDVRVPGTVYDDFDQRIPISEESTAALLLGLSANKAFRNRWELSLETNVFALPISEVTEEGSAESELLVYPGLGWVNNNFLTLQGSLVVRYFFWRNLARRGSGAAN